MNFRKMLADFHPELKEKYASRQYELAQKIIAKKLTLKVSQPVLAFFMGVSYDRYLDMESGSVNVPVKDYELALEKVENLIRTETEPEFIEAIYKFPSFAMRQSKEPVKGAVLFNNKHDFFGSVKLNLKEAEKEKVMLKKSNIPVKKLNVNSFFNRELNETDVYINEMNNGSHNKGIKRVAKTSFELKEDVTSEMPISA